MSQEYARNMQLWQFQLQAVTYKAKKQDFSLHYGTNLKEMRVLSQEQPGGELLHGGRQRQQRAGQTAEHGRCGDARTVL